MFDNGLRLQAGPQLGILVSAKSILDNSNLDLNDTKPVDVSLSFGASYVAPSTGFGMDVRYNLGLNNINKDSGPASTNRGFQLGVFIFSDITRSSLKDYLTSFYFIVIYGCLQGFLIILRTKYQCTMNLIFWLECLKIKEVSCLLTSFIL